MRKSCQINKQALETRRGAASLYVVIFTTLLLGIVTLSYVRIIVAEVSQGSNTDLSQSAYDSALAGVEDAKSALLRYHECLSTSPSSRSAICNRIISTMQAKLNKDDCDTVKATLFGAYTNAEADKSGEVIIAERTGSAHTSDNNSSTNLLQAYTCVTIAEELDDYLTTLNNGDRFAVIPVRTSQINNINTIAVRWFAKGQGSLNYMSNNLTFKRTANNGPPVLYTELIQAGTSFIPNNDFNVNNGNKTNRAEVFLYPTSDNSSTTKITAAQFATTADKTPDTSTAGAGDRVWKVNCKSSWGNNTYACTAVIGIPRPVNDTNRSDNATLLRIGLPYGTPETDVSVTLYSGNANTVQKYYNGENVNPGLIRFQGVQAKIDSTGRANDVFRRLDTRINLDDNSFPYPEFTIESKDNIAKDFYITRDCWYSNNENKDRTTKQTCPQNSQYE